jgi:hypothetical protein
VWELQRVDVADDAWPGALSQFETDANGQRGWQVCFRMDLSEITGEKGGEAKFE